MARRHGWWIAATGLALAGGTAPAQAQSTVRASVDSGGNEASGASTECAISGDGRFIAFTSAADDLVPFDTNGVTDLFVHDLATGATERVSVSTAGVEGNLDSSEPTISYDGRFVAFSSRADNLVAVDTNSANDIFVHDRKTASTWLASLNNAGGQATRPSVRPSISSDGRFVAFQSSATNLVPGDTNSAEDIFVRDLVGGTTERVSVDGAGVQANGPSFAPKISGDGSRVAFSSAATNLVAGDLNGQMDVFLHDRPSGATLRVNIAWNGAEATNSSDFAAISSNGQVVSFGSNAPNLVPNDLNGASDTFLVDLAAGTIERVSVDSAGQEGSATSDLSDLSSDGRYVAFLTWADDLVAGDANASSDVLVRDRRTGTTWRVSVAFDGGEGSSDALSPAISNDGHVLAFASAAPEFVAGDANGVDDAFVRRVATASATAYGAGWPGTLGAPDLTTPDDPTLGAAVTIDVGNSAGIGTTALLAVGYDRADIPTTAGGTLRVDAALWLVLPVPSLGLSLHGALPDDETLDGFVLDMQVLEADAGASNGISFSRGLELVLGR